MFKKKEKDEGSRGNSNRNFITKLLLSLAGIVAGLLVATSAYFIYEVNVPAPAVKKSVLESNWELTHIENFNISSLSIIEAYPQDMELKHAYIIRVSLMPFKETDANISDLKIEKARTSTSGIDFIGSPGATLKNAFGPGYTAVATAKLSPEDGPFKVTPIGLIEQTLDQPEVNWSWSIVPQEPQEEGKNYLNISVDATWKSGSGKILGPYHLGGKPVEVQITIPTPTPVPMIQYSPITIDFVKILYFLYGIVGIGGFGGLIYAARRWWKKRNKRKHK